MYLNICSNILFIDIYNNNFTVLTTVITVINYSNWLLFMYICYRKYLWLYKYNVGLLSSIHRDII